MDKVRIHPYARIVKMDLGLKAPQELSERSRVGLLILTEVGSQFIRVLEV